MVLGSVSGKGAIRLRNVWVRSWVAVFFFLIEKLLIAGQNFFSKCLKNGTSCLQKGQLPDTWL